MVQFPEYTCEAVVDYDYSEFAPLLIKCHKPAKLRKIKGFLFEVAMCDECMTAWRKKNAK